MKISLKAISEGAKIIEKTVAKNSPTILTIVGVGMMIGGVVVTIIEAPKAEDEIEELEDNYELTHKEYINRKTRIILYHYWKTAALTIGGAGVIFWGHKISLGRTAAALAAYQMSKDDLKKLEEKIIETDGEKHLEKMKDDICRDEVKATDFSDEKIIQTGKGDILFIDSITGQKFYSNFDAIDRAVNSLNADIHSDPELTAPLNNWLSYLGCETTNIGDKLGWRFTKQGQNVDVKYRCVKRDTGEVVHLIEYTVVPIWDFDIIESSDRYSGYTW